MEIVGDECLQSVSNGFRASSTRLGVLTVASLWFSFTPRARRRWASRPNCEMTSLSSYRAVSEGLLAAVVPPRPGKHPSEPHTSLGHSCIVYLFVAATESTAALSN